MIPHNTHNHDTTTITSLGEYITNGNFLRRDSVSSISLPLSSIWYLEAHTSPQQRWWFWIVSHLGLKGVICTYFYSLLYLKWDMRWSNTVFYKSTDRQFSMRDLFMVVNIDSVYIEICRCILFRCRHFQV